MAGVFAMGRYRAKRPLLIAGFFTILTGLGATVAAMPAGLLGAKLAVAVGVLMFYAWPYLACLFASGRADLGHWVGPGSRRWLAPVGLIAPYVIYGLGTGTFSLTALMQVATFVVLPLALWATAGQRAPGQWQDFAAVAAVWLPFNFGLLDGIWEWPEGQAAYIMNTPLAINVALVGAVTWRRFHFVKLRWQVNRAELAFAGAMLLAFMVVALPVGLVTGFLEIHPRIDPLKIIGEPLGIFFFIAVPEELLFRGLVQGLLLRRTQRPWLATVLASCLFGLSHWHEATPNWTYIGLASVAGLCYGLTYLRSRSLVVPALLHASVDTIWALLFHV